MEEAKGNGGGRMIEPTIKNIKQIREIISDVNRAITVAYFVGLAMGALATSVILAMIFN